MGIIPWVANIGYLAEVRYVRTHHHGLKKDAAYTCGRGESLGLGYRNTARILAHLDRFQLRKNSQFHNFPPKNWHTGLFTNVGKISFVTNFKILLECLLGSGDMHLPPIWSNFRDTSLETPHKPPCF